MSEENIKKDKSCLHCKHIFDCKGKEKRVSSCLMFEERKKNGRDKVD